METKVFSLIKRIWLKFYSTRIFKFIIGIARFILPKGEKIYSIHNGLKMGIDFGNDLERGTFFNVAEPKAIDKFLSVVSNGDTVIDVGAFIGTYTLLAARQVGHQGLVISLEPNPHNYERLTRNIELNEFTNIKAFNCAAGEKSGMKHFNMKSFLSNIDSLNQSRVIVEVKTLDVIIKENSIDSVKLVKIDVEGYECNVLKGLTDSFRNHMIKNLLIEAHPIFLLNYRSSVYDIYKLLEQYGFKWEEFKEPSHMEKSTIYVLAHLPAH